MSGELGLRGQCIVSMQRQFLSWEILGFPDDLRQAALPRIDANREGRNF